MEMNHSYFIICEHVLVDKNHPIKCSGVDYVQQTLSGKLSYRMTIIETKQNELDAKVTLCCIVNKFKPKPSMTLRVCFLPF
jgi:hypothetical protein